MLREWHRPKVDFNALWVGEAVCRAAHRWAAGLVLRRVRQSARPKIINHIVSLSRCGGQIQLNEDTPPAADLRETPHLALPPLGLTHLPPLARAGTALVVPKTKVELSARSERVVLFEYIEEHPPMLSNVGMGTRISTYYRRRHEVRPPACRLLPRPLRTARARQEDQRDPPEEPDGLGIALERDDESPLVLVRHRGASTPPLG
jgi:hypothetical protein